MLSKTKRIVDLSSNRNGEDTSNRQVQGRRATHVDPGAPRQETLQDDHSLHDKT